MFIPLFTFFFNSDLSLSIAQIIIIITSLISITAFYVPSLMSAGMMNPYAVKHDNQWYRLITGGFLHLDWNHLFANMLSFFFFGPALLTYFQFLFGNEKGTIDFLILYIAAIIVANIPDFIKYHNYAYFRSLGASGAVSAIIFSAILINPLGGIYIFFIPVAVPAVIYGVLFLAYSWYMGRKGDTRVGHDAHFYGAVFGFVFTIILKPELFTLFVEQIKARLVTL